MKSGCWAKKHQQHAPNAINYCDNIFPTSVDPERHNCYLEIQSISCITLIIWMKPLTEESIKWFYPQAWDIAEIWILYYEHYLFVDVFVLGFSHPMLTSIRLPRSRLSMLLIRHCIFHLHHMEKSIIWLMILILRGNQSNNLIKIWIGVWWIWKRFFLVIISFLLQPGLKKLWSQLDWNHF